MTSQAHAAAGTVVMDFGGNTTDRFRLLRVGPDDRILVEIGTDSASASDTHCGVFGFDSNGKLIGSFGSAGRLSLDACAADLKFQPDGSLYLLNPDTPAS